MPPPPFGRNKYPLISGICLAIIVALMIATAVYVLVSRSDALLTIDDPDALRTVLKQSVHDKGLRDDIRHLLGQDGNGGGNDNYGKVLAHIGTGDEKWLKVADALQCCVSTVGSEALDWTMADAFIRAPEAVLRRRPMNSLGGICDAFIGASDDEPTKALFEERVKAVNMALQRVKDPALQEKRAECQKLIHEEHWSDYDAHKG